MSETTTPTDRAGLQSLAREKGWQVADSTVISNHWSASHGDENIDIHHGVDEVAVGVWTRVHGRAKALHSAADVRAVLEGEG